MSDSKQHSVPHADHDRARATPELGLQRWAETCPGSFERLWSKNPQGQRRQHRQAEDAFPATLTMGLSDL
jgi:hypothetical protein